MSQSKTAEPPTRELSNAEVARLLGMIAKRLDQQTASFAALAGIVATLQDTRSCDPKLAMGAAGLMIPKTAENEAMRKAAAANVVAILGAGRAIDTLVEKLTAAAEEAASPARETQRVKE
jgi:hypothetical protein